MSRALCEAGAHVILNGRNDARLKDFEGELRGEGHSVERVAFDVADFVSVRAYFARLDALFIEAKFDVVLYRLLYWQGHRFAWAAQLLGDYVKFIVISMRLLRHVKDPVLRTTYRTQLARALRALDRNDAALADLAAAKEGLDLFVRLAVLTSFSCPVRRRRGAGQRAVGRKTYCRCKAGMML
jgi:NAD(P)-dependent dehydrogenase (short-subunit alcohol dehydrogenase family)